MILTRWHYGPDCTLGWLEHDGLKLATIERPWLPNPAGIGGVPKQSCIPDGSYAVENFTGTRFTEVFRLSSPLLGVYRDQLPPGQDWGRHSILIHAGNCVTDVVGCIAVGLRHTVIGGYPMVLQSADALLALREALRTTQADVLTIQPYRGTQEVCRA
jgi:hypothetical protein